MRRLYALLRGYLYVNGSFRGCLKAVRRATFRSPLGAPLRVPLKLSLGIRLRRAAYGGVFMFRAHGLGFKGLGVRSFNALVLEFTWLAVYCIPPRHLRPQDADARNPADHVPCGQACHSPSPSPSLSTARAGICSMAPQTPSPKPQTHSPKPSKTKMKPGPQNPKPQTLHLFRVWGLGLDPKPKSPKGRELRGSQRALLRCGAPAAQCPGQRRRSDRKGSKDSNNIVLEIIVIVY